MFKPKTKSVIYTIQCDRDPAHEFDREFIIVEGSEDTHVSDAQIYCPHCERLLTVKINGKIASDTGVFRSAKRV